MTITQTFQQMAEELSALTAAVSSVQSPEGSTTHRQHTAAVTLYTHTSVYTLTRWWHNVPAMNSH